MRLTPMSNDSFDLVAAARRCAEAAWKGPKECNQGGYAYAKAGVILDDLLLIAQRPLTLLDSIETRSPALMAALDAVNSRYGKNSLVLAREGFAQRASMKQQYRSLPTLHNMYFGCSSNSWVSFFLSLNAHI